MTIGCVGDAARPRSRARAASAARLQYVAPPDRFVQSSLLTFDSPYDVAFIDEHDVKIGVDPERPANRAWVARGAPIKLGALLSGREFPGPWDLIGFRARSDVPVKATLCLRQDDSLPNTTPVHFDVAPGGWRTLWFDLSRLTAGPTSRPAGDAVAGLSLCILPAERTSLLIDDLVLAQGRTTVAESAVPASGERWRVRRIGSEWQELFGDEIVLRLPSLPFVPGGFRVAEAGTTRVLFVTADGSRTICVDRTGRLNENGRARLDPAVVKHAKAIAENASPAQIEVVGDVGRVERSSPGDHDNDGYDETRGTYCLRAQGNRVVFRLTRQRATVRWPVVEIAGLPPGSVTVWLEGQVVPWTTRLDDGRVIVELPIDLERPVEVQVRVK